MKKLILSAVLAAVLGSPALAQSYDPDLGSGNITPSAYAHAGRGAYRAPIRAPHDDAFNAYARIGGNIVMPDGAVATDPDPNIQFQLNRESEQGEW